MLISQNIGLGEQLELIFFLNDLISKDKSFLWNHMQVNLLNLYSVDYASLCSTSEVMLKQVNFMVVQIMSVPASSGPS